MSLLYLLMIATMLVGVIVQFMLKSRFNSYQQIRLDSYLTGADVARKMLKDHGIYDVNVTEVNGILTDHYDPSAKVIRLSSAVYNGSSIAAAAVAAHECGHAVQHAKGYLPLQLRSLMVPIVSFANNIVHWILLLGIVLINVFPSLIWYGIILFAATTVFSVITLPVEINASYRAISWLKYSNIIIDSRKINKAKSALRWAAYTYVISAIGSIVTLLYYIGIANRD